jgi:DNA-binding transcriptional LysR family regulator
MDVDTRLLRYFAAVAEEGHLTRAASRLFVSQPALTKQIKQLEAQLGVTLFERSRAGMELTEPGRELAERLPALLSGWDETVRQTRATASRAAHVLRIGYVASAANEATQRIVAAFAARQPDWRVDMRQAAWSDPSAGLADGAVDAALVRLPLRDQQDLRVEVLFTESRCVALPTSHPLAASTEPIAFHELLDEPFVAAPPETGWWRDYWLATDERNGHKVQIGAVAEHRDDWLSAIANGYGVGLAPESAMRFYARPGITYRPVTGVSPTHVAVAWPPAAEANPVVQDFVRCCREAAQRGRRDRSSGQRSDMSVGSRRS